MTAAVDAEGKIVVEVSERIATVLIDRPHVRNAMDKAMWRSLETTFEALAQREDVRVLIVQGAGGNFCAGSDIKEIHEQDTEGAETIFAQVEAALSTLETVPYPVIGVATGVAAGGGCQLLLACDLRLVTPSARIGMPISRLGITASPEFVERVVRAVGVSRASDLYLSGRLIDGEEAWQWGMVQYLLDDTEIDDEAKRLAARIARSSPASLRQSKRLLTGRSRLAFDGSPAQKGSHRFLGNPEEFWEGVQAFVEKREPRF